MGNPYEFPGIGVAEFSTPEDAAKALALCRVVVLSLSEHLDAGMTAIRKSMRDVSFWDESTQAFVIRLTNVDELLETAQKMMRPPTP